MNLSSGHKIVVVIPALNEEQALPRVLAAMPDLVDQVIVVDNGSTDGTARVATAAGATVIREARRGYGSACLAGAAAALDGIIVFMDGDGSDNPADLPRLVEPIVNGSADLVIGSRTLGQRERGSLLLQARWGNALAAFLIRLLFGARVSDLGPFRAIRGKTYRSLGIDDAGYGFPSQLQVRAIARGLRVVEVPVSYRRRIGRSKISGTLRGAILAGWAIIATIIREYRWRPPDASRKAR